MEQKPYILTHYYALKFVLRYCETQLLCSQRLLRVVLPAARCPIQLLLSLAASTR